MKFHACFAVAGDAALLTWLACLLLQVTEAKHMQQLQQRLWTLLEHAMNGDNRSSAAAKLIKQLPEDAVWEIMLILKHRLLVSEQGQSKARLGSYLKQLDQVIDTDQARTWGGSSTDVSSRVTPLPLGCSSVGTSRATNTPVPCQLAGDVTPTSSHSHAIASHQKHSHNASAISASSGQWLPPRTVDLSPQPTIASSCTGAHSPVGPTLTRPSTVTAVQPAAPSPLYSSCATCFAGKADAGHVALSDVPPVVDAPGSASLKPVSYAPRFDDVDETEVQTSDPLDTYGAQPAVQKAAPVVPNLGDRIRAHQQPPKGRAGYVDDMQTPRRLLAKWQRMSSTQRLGVLKQCYGQDGQTKDQQQLSTVAEGEVQTSDSDQLASGYSLRRHRQSEPSAPTPSSPCDAVRSPKTDVNADAQATSSKVANVAVWLQKVQGTNKESAHLQSHQPGVSAPHYTNLHRTALQTATGSSGTGTAPTNASADEIPVTAAASPTPANLPDKAVSSAVIYAEQKWKKLVSRGSPTAQSNAQLRNQHQQPTTSTPGTQHGVSAALQSNHTSKHSIAAAQLSPHAVHTPKAAQPLISRIPSFSDSKQPSAIPTYSQLASMSFTTPSTPSLNIATRHASFTATRQQLSSKSPGQVTPVRTTASKPPMSPADNKVSTPTSAPHRLAGPVSLQQSRYSFSSGPHNLGQRRNSSGGSTQKVSKVTPGSVRSGTKHAGTSGMSAEARSFSFSVNRGRSSSDNGIQRSPHQGGQGKPTVCGESRSGAGGMYDVQQSSQSESVGRQPRQRTPQQQATNDMTDGSPWASAGPSVGDKSPLTSHDGPSRIPSFSASKLFLAAHDAQPLTRFRSFTSLSHAIADSAVNLVQHTQAADDQCAVGSAGLPNPALMASISLAPEQVYVDLVEPLGAEILAAFDDVASAESSPAVDAIQQHAAIGDDILAAFEDAAVVDAKHRTDAVVNEPASSPYSLHQHLQSQQNHLTSQDQSISSSANPRAVGRVEDLVSRINEVLEGQQQQSVAAAKQQGGWTAEGLQQMADAARTKQEISQALEVLGRQGTRTVSQFSESVAADSDYAGEESPTR